MTLTLFQDYRCIRNVNCKLVVLDSCPLYFKLCMSITLLGVYIFILGLMTSTLFQGHRLVINMHFKLRVLESRPLLFKRCSVAIYIKRIMHNMIFVTLV